ncbi:hypothetical protein L345_15153, partial [Ophiophagus hannah]
MSGGLHLPLLAFKRILVPRDQALRDLRQTKDVDRTVLETRTSSEPKITREGPGTSCEKVSPGVVVHQQQVWMAEDSDEGPACDAGMGPGPSGSGMLPSKLVESGSSEEEDPREPVPNAHARRVARRKEQLQQHGLGSEHLVKKTCQLDLAPTSNMFELRVEGTSMLHPSCYETSELGDIQWAMGRPGGLEAKIVGNQLEGLRLQHHSVTEQVRCRSWHLFTFPSFSLCHLFEGKERTNKREGVQRKTQAHALFILGHTGRNGEGSNVHCVAYGGGNSPDSLH